MKILDFELFGNIVKLYLGETVEGIFGDDWNDIPYEHNAGCVYDKFYNKTVEIVFPLDFTVFEPCYGYSNSPYCKNDMLFRKIPCLVFGEVVDSWQYENFDELLEKVPTLSKLYIGDDWDDILVKYGKFFTILNNPTNLECNSIRFNFMNNNDKSITLGIEDIQELRLEHIIKEKSVVKTLQGFSNKEENVAHFFKIFIPNKYNTVYSVAKEFNLTTTVFEKLCKKDIESIEFLNDNIVNETYHFVFNDIDSGMFYENTYQYSHETDDGLYIVITDNMNELDYYIETEMETKNFDDEYLD